MFALTIAFGPHSCRLLYKEEQHATAAFTSITQPVDKTQHFHAELRMTLNDDFGQKACFRLDAITGVMLENLDESKIANIEMGLHQKRTQMSFQQRAEADPTIRAARMSGSPPIITPMGNGRMS